MIATSQRTPHLPFIPAPFPGEILGSWLSRIRLENGGGAWRALLEHVGFQNKLTNPFFDRPDYNEKLCAMLALLGTTYERVLLELTTLPYWLTFTASDSSARLQGTATIPELLNIAAEGEVKSIRHLGSGRPRRQSFEPRYCTDCILQDYKEVGQAYWHRAHQLPNVFFCHKHHSELQVKCGVCGAKPGGQNSKILPLPTLKCQCGFRLDKVKSSRAPSSQELALIRISVRALGEGVPKCHRGGVFKFLKAQLTQRQSSSSRRFQTVIEHAFPGTIVGPADRVSVEKGNVPLRFTRFLKSGSAPECCALIVALDIPYESALAGFIASSVGTNCEREPYIKNDAMTIEDARSAICQTPGLQSRGPISANARLYWFLRMYDTMWLLENFPTERIPPLPTVAEDRLSLQNLLSQKFEENVKNANTKMRQSPAGLRALFRDREWFDEQTTGLKQHSAAGKTPASKSILLTRVASLQEALKKLLASTDRPIRIHASTLGAYVALSESQAVRAVRSSPKLREAIAAANADKLRRQLLWAACQLNQSGGRFTKQQLGRVAGVPRAKISDEILTEIKMLYYRTAPS